MIKINDFNQMTKIKQPCGESFISHHEDLNRHLITKKTFLIEFFCIEEGNRIRILWLEVVVLPTSRDF